MKRLLIVNGMQYGYLIDYYYYAKCLGSQFDITFVCNDDGLKRLEPEGCRVIYVQPHSRINRRLDFCAVIRDLYAKGERFDAALTDFRMGFAFLLPFLQKLTDNVIYDIRSLDVSENAAKRALSNLVIRAEAFMAPKVTVISDLVANKLGLRRYEVLPLGVDTSNLDIAPKVFDADDIQLLYVGTFKGRYLEKTVLGLARYLDAHPEMRDRVHYHIVGAGDGEDKILDAIAATRLAGNVTMHGYVPTNELRRYLEHCNVGVSFVPVCSRYNLQHPTKTYEYISAGMPVIATATAANGEIVNPTNGVLTPDTPEGFAHGLEQVVERFGEYDSAAIKATLGEHHWADIASRLGRLI